MVNSLDSYQKTLKIVYWIFGIFLLFYLALTGLEIFCVSNEAFCSRNDNILLLILFPTVPFLSIISVTVLTAIILCQLKSRYTLKFRIWQVLINGLFFVTYLIEQILSNYVAYKNYYIKGETIT